MGSIRWTEKASSHLQAIHEYIAVDSKTYATRFIKALIKSATSLEHMPLCGRIVPEFNDENIREKFHYNYRIIYRTLTKGDVEILAVVHGARELPKAFEEKK
ncbi:type II toxin-antitoxin system RelE/ParE family toxin [bacterium]|nr:type II toxin-antitoxin system RelE/ParE family toxin [bacterium]